MGRFELLIVTLSTFLLSAHQVGGDGFKVGIVDFSKVISESEIGREEVKVLENLKKKLEPSLDDLNSQLTKVSQQLQDSDFLDSLSHQAVGELKTKFHTLREEMQIQQQQCYQTIQQANMKMLDKVGKELSRASSVVADRDQFNLILSSEVAFHCLPSLNVTDAVISEMDRVYSCR